MKTGLRTILFSTTTMLPVVAWAQAAPPDQNACDQLLQAIDTAGSQTAITKEQAQAYRSSNDLAACQTALRNVRRGTDQSTTAQGQPRVGDRPDATAQGSAPSIQVEQPAPQVTIKQAEPTVSISQGQAEIEIHQPAPIVTVEIPRPEVTITMPQPQVSVSQQQPQVSVNQAEPRVSVIPSQQQAQTETTGAQQPIVKFTADEAKVSVTQAGEPIVNFRQTSPNQQQALGDREQGAVDQSRQNQLGAQQQALADRQQGAADQLRQNQLAAQQQTGDTLRNQQSALNDRNTGLTDAGAQQIAVSKLEGMDLKGEAGAQTIGRITAVILDANNKPFVIVEKGGQMVAVDVDYTRMNGNDLVLFGVSDPDSLPTWDNAKLQSPELTKLSGDQMVAIKTSS